MRCLVVKAHPLGESLSTTVTERVVDLLQQLGHQVELEDLYANDFQPCLTADERAGYYQSPYVPVAVDQQVRRLLDAEAIVLIFPTWWFGFPAILKGWFDRVWVPGVAYDHATGYGQIQPRLGGLRHLLAVTSMGSPWWVDRLLLGQPVKRILKRAILGSCAPGCRFRIKSLYKSEALTADQVAGFLASVEHSLRDWPLR